MWKSINEIECLKSPNPYGTNLYDLFLMTHKILSCSTVKTIFLPPKHFEDYSSKRYVDSSVINSCLEKLNQLNISNQIIIKISVYKSCNIDMQPIITQANYSNIANAISNCFERWFDEKAFAFRCIHKIKNKDTFPTIYIQPYECTNIYSIITRNSINGNLITSGNYQSNIHCNIKFFSELIKQLIDEADDVFAIPHKILFFYRKNSIIIQDSEKYPMTKSAYLNCLVDKHKKHLISDEWFINHISADDIISFDGYKMHAKYIYHGLGNNIGFVTGQIVFRSSDWNTISTNHTQNPYIFVAKEYNIGDLEYWQYCKGALFGRGGLTSHGMVISRGKRQPAISANNFLIDDYNRRIITEFENINEFDSICILASKGEWAKNGVLVPSYHTDIDINPITYLLSVIKPIKEHILDYPIDFQINLSSIIRAIKHLGIQI